MDAVNDPLVEIVVFMKSSQTGGTEILNNTLGYYIDYDPSPILMTQPTLDIGKAYSKDRLAPMLRDTPCLRGKVRDVRSRNSDNTTLHKVFSGGHVTIAGANSPASLASRPIRILLADEVDRYPISAGTEGDPIDLARKRSTTFWNRKMILVSTPTIKGFSRIEKAYEESDMRKFYVPCPECGEMQLLRWANVIWPKDKPQEAVYVCEFCQAQLTDADKIRMVRNGVWKAEKECKGIAGFWINELYSPWVSFGNMATRFIEAKNKGVETLKVFVNTALAETWEEEGEEISQQGIYGRREKYNAQVPMGAGVLVCGADVQKDRIEATVYGFGKNEESWVIDWRAFQGNPANLTDPCWKDFDDYLSNQWKHESGTMLKIACTCIDTGYHTKTAYAFIRPRQIRRIFAIKGANEPGKPLVSRPTTTNIGKVKVFSIGTDTAKETLFSRLKIEDGAGYIHFHDSLDEEFFKQMTAERLITKYEKGVARREWVKIRARNEALDMAVYSLAALAIINPNLDRLVDALQVIAEDKPEEKPKEAVEEVREPARVKPKQHYIQRERRGGWATGWR